MGPTWGRQDPGGPHVGPMNIGIRVDFETEILDNVETESDTYEKQNEATNLETDGTESNTYERQNDRKCFFQTLIWFESLSFISTKLYTQTNETPLRPYDVTVLLHLHGGNTRN